MIKKKYASFQICSLIKVRINAKMALDLLKSAKTILKTDELTIDNGVFKLHYRVTVAILIGASLIGVAKQYFGDPINCQVGGLSCR